MDKQEVTLLVLLDLSAAFDTIDSEILLKCMKSDLGLNGTTLKWYGSYMSGRTQRVKVNDTMSHSFKLAYGVPQGSCNGPILFSIYCRQLMTIVQQHLPEVHGYADDHQLYLSFRPNATNKENAIASM
jgi:hypothetical protein